MHKKQTILIDLDGVLNIYRGNFDEKYIPEIKDGAKEFLAEISKKYEIKLFTTRNKLQTSKWIIKNNLEKYITDITNVKELAMLYIDDRCINFDGNYKNLIKNIEKFKTWYE